VNVSYKCSCMTEEAIVAVADRIEGQDIMDWMDGEVGPALGRDHTARSPLCRETKTQYLKIAIDPGGGQLGTISRQ
jgi:hypothetical protein